MQSFAWIRWVEHANATTATAPSCTPRQPCKATITMTITAVAASLLLLLALNIDGVRAGAPGSIFNVRIAQASCHAWPMPFGVEELL